MHNVVMSITNHTYAIYIFIKIVVLNLQAIEQIPQKIVRVDIDHPQEEVMLF